MKRSELQEKLKPTAREIENSKLIEACQNVAENLGKQEQQTFPGPTQYRFESKELIVVCSYTDWLLMDYIDVAVKENEKSSTVFEARDISYEIKDTEHPTFVPGRCAQIIIQHPMTKKQESIGILGEIIPFVLKNNKIKMPVSSLEIDVQPLLN